MYNRYVTCFAALKISNAELAQMYDNRSPVLYTFGTANHLANAMSCHSAHRNNGFLRLFFKALFGMFYAAFF